MDKLHTPSPCSTPGKKGPLGLGRGGMEGEGEGERLRGWADVPKSRHGTCGQTAPSLVAAPAPRAAVQRTSALGQPPACGSSPAPPQQSRTPAAAPHRSPSRAQPSPLHSGALTLWSLLQSSTTPSSRAARARTQPHPLAHAPQPGLRPLCRLDPSPGSWGILPLIRASTTP